MKRYVQKIKKIISHRVPARPIEFMDHLNYQIYSTFPMKNLLGGMEKLIDWLHGRDWVILPFYVVGSLVHAAIVIVTGMFSFIFFKTIQIWESVKPEIVLFFKKKNKIEQK